MTLIGMVCDHSDTLFGMNEEEIKNNVVLPILHDKGIHAYELAFEKSFSIRIGRRELPIRGDRETARGRLDILVKRRGLNLFVVEAKSGQSVIDEDDRDQAVSYARLVHPIAPYAVVTNGRAWRIFDSITKAELDSKQITIKDGYRLALPEAARDEALGLFLSCSSENLQEFCRTQVDDYMRPLLGSRSDLSGHFVPELHSERHAFRTAMLGFYRRPVGGFLLLGESGIGKTSSLCALSRFLIEEKRPVLFFRGITLEGPLETAIAAEFSWTFAEQQTFIEIVRRLEGLHLKEPLTIIVDAVDEWPYTGKVQNLLALLRHAKPGFMRFVVSCKTEAWAPFAAECGSPTGIEAFLATTSRSGPEQSKGWHLGAFEDQEFHEALARYKEAFGVHGAFEDRVLEQAQRNPFLLRILFEVARDTDQKHITFSALKVFEEYYRRVLDKMADAQIADRTLSAVARRMYVSNQDWIDEARLCEVLNLSVNEGLAPQLFTHNVLVRRRRGSSIEIGFHFSQLRDFIVCFRALRLQDMNVANFQTEVRSNKWRGVHLEALQFYYRYASEQHRRAIDEPLHTAACLYLRSYKEVINRHFPSLRVRFPGCSGSRTGFFGELYLPQRRLKYYGFRDIGPDDPEILFHPIDNLGHRSNLSFIYGVHQLFWAGDLRADERQTWAMVLRYLQHELEGAILEKGGLIERDAPALMIELLLGYIRRAAAGYQGPQQAPFLNAAMGKFWDNRRRCPAYPIRLDDIEESLLWSDYYMHFEHEHFEQKRGQLRQSGLNFSVITCTREDYRLIGARADEAFRRREQITLGARYVGQQETKRWCGDTLGTLRSHGINSIEGPVARNHDLLESAFYQTDQLDLVEQYVEDLWIEYLRSYKMLVEANFPTLKRSFELYSAMPLRVHIAVDSFNRWGPTGRPEPQLGLRIAPAKASGSENEVVICRSIDCRKKGPAFEVFADGERVDASSFRMTSISDLAFSRQSCDPMRLDSLRTPLRKMVYGRIREELPLVLAELFRHYDVPYAR